jgi:hypothetical protein
MRSPSSRARTQEPVTSPLIVDGTDCRTVKYLAWLFEPLADVTQRTLCQPAHPVSMASPAVAVSGLRSDRNSRPLF